MVPDALPYEAAMLQPTKPRPAVAPTILFALLTVPGVIVAAAAPSDAESSPPPFDQVCFGDFDDRQPYPPVDELRDWLVPVPGEECVIAETTKRLGGKPRRMGHIAGVFQLNRTWQPHSTLRLSLVDPELFQLHFWSGAHGVTVRYSVHAAKTWAAYGTTRSGTRPRPATYASWALDCGRYRRAGLGTVEIRYHDDNIVLTRGDLMLLSAPLPGLPTEVYLEGGALIRGLSVYPSSGGPKPPASNPTVWCLGKPAQQNWEATLPLQARLEKLPDAAVRLVAGPQSTSCQAGLEIPRPGLYEYIFELERADVGTGIYLGRGSSQLARFAFFRDKTTGRTAFAPLSPDSQNTELELNFRRAMVPYAGQHQWVRLTAGGGVMKCWTSGDRVHWSQSVWSPLPLRGAVTHVGLYCLATGQPRSITLRSLEIRRFDVLASLAAEKIQQRTGSWADVETLSDFQRRVGESRPTDISPKVWQRACILRMLTENPYFSLGGVLLHRLLDEALLEEEDVRRQLELLDEAAVMIHSLDARSTEPFQRHYQRLGKHLIRSGHPDPLDVIRLAVMRTPIWDYQRQNAWPSTVLRRVLLASSGEGRWQEVDELLGSLRFWTTADRLQRRRLPWSDQVQHLLDWAEFQLARRRSETPDEWSQTKAHFWRDRLIGQLDRASYNVIAEFRAALDEQAYREACQILTSSGRTALPGLVPDDRDQRLSVSLPVAVELAMRQRRPLRETMQGHFAALGQLRLRRGMAAVDSAAVEAVTSQFCGTEAAAEAHAWLADRELSAARAARAVGRYRDALRQGVAAAQQPGLLARLRLAGALSGEDLGGPVKAPLDVGGRQFSVAAFEKMVREIRQAHSQPNAAVASLAGLQKPNTSSRWQARRLAQVSVAGAEGPSDIPPRRLDWGARLIAATVSSGQMIISTPGELAAFDLASGRRRWSAPATLKGEPTGWPLISMWPVCRGERILVRRLTDAGAELACFDALDGRLLHSSRAAGYVASDPLLVAEELFAFTASADTSKTTSLRLARFDPDSAQVRCETPVAEFHDLAEGDDSATGMLCCQAAAAEGRIVATAAGCVLCCDLDGRVRWVRRQIWIRRPLAEYSETEPWLRRRHRPPIAFDGRVYVTQPGVWGIECLELATGRLVWRKSVPQLTALIGRVGDRLIVETSEGLLAKAIATGETLWSHDAANRLNGWLCGPEQGIVYTRLAASDGGSSTPHPVLVRVDPATGTASDIPVQGLPAPQEPLLGPLISDGTRHWVFLASAETPAEREIVELTTANNEP